MAKIVDITKDGQSVYPRTIADAVAVSGKVLTEALEAKADKTELDKKANTDDLVFVKGEGKCSQASYYYFNGEKTLNLTRDDYSHAEGMATKAIGYCSHSEGDSTTAEGPSSHSEGYNTYARGGQSHAEGFETTAYESYSHSEGAYNTAKGSASHAEGEYTISNGVASHAEGWQTVANNQSEHAEGYYNTSTKSSVFSEFTLHSIGNGWGEDKRHNAVEVKFNGDYYIQSQTTTDDSSIKTYEAPMKRLQTWFNEKQNKLVAGTNVTLTANSDNTVTISASGGSSLPSWISSSSSANIIGSTDKETQIVSKDNTIDIGGFKMKMDASNNKVLFSYNGRMAEIPLVGNEWTFPLTREYKPYGESFITEIDYDHYRLEKLVFVIDGSSCKVTNENILSIGTSIADWGYKQDMKNLHIFFTKNSNTPLLLTYCDSKDQINPTNSTNTSIQNYYTVKDKSKFTIAFSAYGIEVDGVLIDQFTPYVQRLSLEESKLQIGSVQGNDRSNAVYLEAYKTYSSSETSGTTGTSGTTMSTGMTTPAP